MRDFFTDTVKTVEKMLWYGHWRLCIKTDRQLSDFISSGNFKRIEDIAKDIERLIEAGEPMPMVKAKHLWDFREGEKTESDKAQLAAYIAIGSIVGKRPYAKTNKQHIVSRMFGFSSHKAIPNKLQPTIKGLLCKYSLRYHIDKLIQELELNWHVCTYSHHMRGIYVGIGVNKDTLALAGESKKKKIKIAQLKKGKSEAREKALKMIEQHLNKGEQLNK